MAEMKQFGIDLELDDAVAQGHYSNLAIISHSTSEFIIDFATDRKSTRLNSSHNVISRMPSSA